MIHVASDQTYRLNESGVKEDRALNVDSRGEMRNLEEDDRIYNELVRIAGLVENDPAFSESETEYVKFRLNRARSWERELDTVLSELVYYFDMEGISTSSPTSIAVTAFAEERYNRRSRREGPIAFEHRKITEQIKKEVWNQTLMAMGNSEALEYMQ